MRTLVTIIVFGLIAVVSIPIASVSILLAWICFLLLTIMFVTNAIRKVPANPPHKAILVFLGQRQEIVLDEGLNWVPLSPFVFDFILIKVEKVVQDLAEQIVRTPDLAEIGAKVSLTWLPGSEGKDYAKSLINYLNTGGEAGVRKNLNDTLEDRLRTWAASNQEGPSDWVEAMSSKDEALEVLLKAILGDSLPKVESDIPTTAWMKFFSRPKRKPSQNEIKMGWSPPDPASSHELWTGLQAEFEALKENKKKLEDQVEARMKAVKEIKEGRGTYKQEALGITILRFTVNEISVKGETAKAAELDAKEKREAIGESRETKNLSRRIKKLREGDPEMSLEEAIRIAQIQQGKIKETVIRVIGAATGFGQDAIATVATQGMLNNPGGKPAAGSSDESSPKKSEGKTKEEYREEYEKNKKEDERIIKEAEEREKNKS